MTGMSRTSVRELSFRRAIIGFDGSCLAKAYALGNKQDWKPNQVNRVFEH